MTKKIITIIMGGAIALLCAFGIGAFQKDRTEVFATSVQHEFRIVASSPLMLTLYHTPEGGSESSYPFVGASASTAMTNLCAKIQELRAKNQSSRITFEDVEIGATFVVAADSTGDIYLAGKLSTSATDKLISNLGATTIHIESGEFSNSAINGTTIYNASSGALNISGGSVLSLEGNAILNMSNGKITISETDSTSNPTFISSSNGYGGYSDEDEYNLGTINLIGGARDEVVLEINGGTITNESPKRNARNIYNVGSGTININDGTITATGLCRALYLENDSILNVNGGLIASYDAEVEDVVRGGYAIYSYSAQTPTITDYSVVNIRGGIVSTQSGEAIDAFRGIYNITGGTVSAVSGHAIYSSYSLGAKIYISEADPNVPTIITSANVSSTSPGTIHLGSSSDKGDFEISGGLIMNTGSVSNGTPVAIYKDKMNDLRISGGRVEVANGYAIYHAAISSSLLISGGIIDGGDGIAIYNADKGSIRISEQDKENNPTIIRSQNSSSLAGVICQKDYSAPDAGRELIDISGGLIENTSSHANANVIYHRTVGNIYIKGGEVKGVAGKTIYNYGNGNIHISGGKVWSQSSYAIYNYSIGKLFISGTALIESQNSAAMSGVVYLYSGVTGQDLIEQNGGTIINTSASADAIAIYQRATGIVKLSAGVVSAASGTALYAAGNAVVELGSATLIGADVAVNCASAGKINISFTPVLTGRLIAAKENISIVLANFDAQSNVYVVEVRGVATHDIAVVNAGTYITAFEAYRPNAESNNCFYASGSHLYFAIGNRISFDTGEKGSEVKPFIAYMGTDISYFTPEVPTHDSQDNPSGYDDVLVFAEWQYLGATYAFVTMPSSDITVDALWIEDTREDFTLTFYANSGQGTMGSQPLKKGETFSIPKNTFTKENYSFVGWALSAAGEKAYDDEDSFLVIYDVKLYAVWEINRHSIVFDANGGQGTMNTIVEDYGTTISLPEIGFVRGGYVFAGWSLTKTGEVDYIDQAQFDLHSDLTLFAVWQKDRYTISFNVNNGTGTMQSQVGDVDDTIQLNKNTFTREHYEFAGWSTVKDGNVEFLDQANYTIGGNAVLYAVWIPKLYSITFETNGGSAISKMNKEYNSSISEPAAPTKDGYTFDGWYSDSDLTNSFDFNRMPAENITLYAAWKKDRTNCSSGSTSSFAGPGAALGMGVLIMLGFVLMRGTKLVFHKAKS